jgi:hypothetical protein
MIKTSSEEMLAYTEEVVRIAAKSNEAVSALIDKVKIFKV